MRHTLTIALPLVADQKPTRPSVSAKLDEPTARGKPDDAALCRKRERRLRRLVAGLVAVLVVHAAASLDLERLWYSVFVDGGMSDRERDFRDPVEQCVTEKAVLTFVDGKSVYRDPPSKPGTAMEWITLRKEAISSLRMRSDGGTTTHLRFRYDDGRQRYWVEGTFWSPFVGESDHHWHGEWSSFEGKAVPSR